MNIKVLGTRGEIKESAPYHSKKSGILLDDKLLLDCGDKRFLDLKPDYILITHLHPDHAFFVRNHVELNYMLTHKNSLKSIYAPDDFDQLNIIPTYQNTHFNIENYHIAIIPTVHSVKVKSNAYLITKNNTTLLYTGDLIWIDKEYHNMLKNIDLVITEASFMRNHGLVRRDKKTGQIYGHTGIPNLINLFKKFTKMILFVHFGSWFYKNMKNSHKEFATLAQKNNIKIIVGYDGMKLKI